MNKNSIQPSIRALGTFAGFSICFLLILYSLLMKYYNFIDYEIAWAFNTVFLIGGLIATYRYYRSRTKPVIDYFPGLLLGCTVTAASVIPFAVLLYIYLSLKDPALLLLLKDNVLFMGEPVTPVRVALATLIEGACSGLITSFIIMQYFKAGFRRTLSRTETMG